jgi:colanic acid/amylovoran biosynthesis glycosyltransferase
MGWIVLPEIKNQTPHIVSFYGFDLSMLPKSKPIWKTRYTALFSKVAGVLCEGEHMASCIEELGCNRAKIHVQHLGIQIDRMQYKPRTWDGNEPLRVLLAGTFTEKKGFPYALLALGKLAKKLPLHITIIGDADRSADSQNEKQRILKSIIESEIRSKVTLLGYCSHKLLIETAYKNHIFLSPSITAKTGDTEGGAPVTIIEMAASGMPIISTNHCDIPSVILDGKSGLLAEEKDVDGIYKRLLWLSSNTDKWKTMLDCGRKHIESNFDACKQGIILSKIYKDINNLKYK